MGMKKTINKHGIHSIEIKCKNDLERWINKIEKQDYLGSRITMIINDDRNIDWYFGAKLADELGTIRVFATSDTSLTYDYVNSRTTVLKSYDKQRYYCVLSSYYFSQTDQRYHKKRITDVLEVPEPLKEYPIIQYNSFNPSNVNLKNALVALVDKNDYFGIVTLAFSMFYPLFKEDNNKSCNGKK